MNCDNTAVLKKLKNGDLEAFNTIYNLHAPKLYLRLTKLVKDPIIVQDILQELFLKVWYNKAKIDTSKGFVSYLNHIADNLAIDFFRKIKRDKKMQFEIWASAIDMYYHTEEQVISKDARYILQKAIDSLSPKKREILILNKFHDKSYKEIADSLNISISTVSNQLVYAIKDIKAYIHHTYRHEYIIAVLLFYI